MCHVTGIHMTPFRVSRRFHSGRFAAEISSESAGEGRAHVGSMLSKLQADLVGFDICWERGPALPTCGCAQVHVRCSEVCLTDV